MDRTDPSATRVLDTAELWAPVSGAWSRTSRLGTERYGAEAVTLADGRILLVGGVQDPESPRSALRSTEVYDPVTDQWDAAGDLSIARSGFSLVAMQDGSALVIGGVGSSAGERLARVERFDPVLNGWTLTEDLPQPVVGATAATLADGRVLLAGGVVRDPEPLDTDGDPYVSGMTANALLFDPSTARWTATTPMPGPRAGASSVLLRDGSVLVVGGSRSEGELWSTPGCPEAASEVYRYVPTP